MGSDRGLKRLKVMPITPDVLEHPEGFDPDAADRPGGPAPTRIELGRSLEEALAAILLSDDGFVAVFEGPAFRGTLTVDAIYRALRASRDSENPGRDSESPGGG